MVHKIVKVISEIKMNNKKYYCDVCEKEVKNIAYKTKLIAVCTKCANNKIN